MKKKSFATRICTLLLAGLMVFLAVGCGNTANTNKSDEQEINPEKAIDDTTSIGDDGSVAMGRYVENMTDLSEHCITTNGINSLSNGNLEIWDLYTGRLASEDNGLTWNLQDSQWFTKLQKEKAYIMDIAVGADGTIGMIYENSAKETTDKLNPDCIIIKPDGTQVKAQFSLTTEEGYPNRIYMSEEGRVFVTILGEESIYEVKEDGSTEKFLTLEKQPQLIQFHDNFMMIDGYHYDKGILIYDLNKEEYVEDEILNDFITENYGDRGFDSESGYDFYFFPGEENVLYMAGNKGLHRHVIGGSAIEEVINGNLSSFSNPAHNIEGMIALPDNEFLALFGGGKLVRFTYNPEIPTIPSKRLKVYSLQESDTLRQAISIYQTKFSDVFVEYEIGMGSDSSVTREDALKKLNTKVMAGEGPDLMVLDQMPIGSYIDKGMLLDLSKCLDSLTGEAELFPNIVEAFKENNKIYTIPCEVEIPITLGKEKYTKKMNDLEDTADVIEELRKENPEKEILFLYSEKAVMRLFSMVAAPSWKTDSGELNREAITEFLTQTKRIYDAVMEGVPQKSIDFYNKTNEDFMQSFGAYREDLEFIRKPEALGYVGGSTQIIIGALSDEYAYANLNSVQRVKGFEDNNIIPLSGQSQNVFIPQTMVGINAASSHTELAEDFLKVLLGKDNQASLFKGLAINKAAFEENFTVDESSIAVYGEDGLSVALDIYSVTEEQIRTLKDWISASSTPYITDVVLEEAVYEEGIDFIQGNQNLEEAVNNVAAKVAIYMAE